MQQNEFQPGEIWMDTNGVPINAHGGGILFHNGTYYWYGEHKTEGQGGNTAHVGVHVYASKDLYHWTDEGIALKVSDDPKSDIVNGCIIERPKVLYNSKTMKYVMWFHLELKGQGYSAARAAVAISDKPAGPFHYLESFRLNPGVWPMNFKEGDKSEGDETILKRDFADGQMSRDMTLFLDKDGKAYQITASEENRTLHISQLSDDYLHPDGKYVRALKDQYNEAPAIFRYNGKYYLFSSGCTGWAPNAARLAMADSIWGPWVPLGNPCVGPKEVTHNTFESQSTFILPVQGKKDAFIFMADRWHPENAIDGRYVWLPVQFKNGIPFLQWVDRWNLHFFDSEDKK
jgi:beta-xylosidase